MYFVGARLNDWSNFDEYYQAVVFDELNIRPESSERGVTQQEETWSNLLLRILDGQKIQLDSKYGRVIKKSKLPIVLLA